MCKEYSPQGWHFTRRYKINEKDRDARGAVALKSAQATMNQQQQTQKNNQAKIDQIDKQVEEITKQNIAAVQAQKYDQIDKGNQKINELIEQKKKLMGIAESDAANHQSGAVANHDIEATFSLQTGSTDLEAGDYQPFSAPLGKGYQRQYDVDGNPERDLKLVFGTTVVYITGDPARVDGLFHAAKLQPLQALR